jgi:hypothetical protein
MHTRRAFLANSFLAAGALAASPQDAQPVTVRVDTGQTLGAIAPDFMGLGYEISSVSRPGLLAASNPVYVQLVRTLGARGVIRVGGNTSDYAHYSPSAPPVSTSFGSVINDAVLRDLGAFLNATGWNLIWGLNLGIGTEEEAIAETKAVLSAAGKNIRAFEIGNEPDLFARNKHRGPDYGYPEWLADYRRYKAALRARFPQLPLAGPDAAVKPDWVTHFAADEGSDAVLLTHHYYREGQNPTSTIEKLLGPDPKLLPELERFREASRSSQRPYRICEVNSFSGGGRPGVSDTFAGALWVLDYMFTLASYGCSGVNMETGVNQLDFISPYSPIGDDEHGHYVARPEYYGMLAFSVAGHGQFLKTELTSDVTGLSAYATQPSPGSLSLTLINKTPRAHLVTGDCQGPLKPRHADALRLSASAIDAKNGITLGSAEVSPSGTWKRSHTDRLEIRDGQFTISIPPYCAAIIEAR